MSRSSSVEDVVQAGAARRRSSRAPRRDADSGVALPTPRLVDCQRTSQRAVGALAAGDVASDEPGRHRLADVAASRPGPDDRARDAQARPGPRLTAAAAAHRRPDGAVPAGPCCRGGLRGAPARRRTRRRLAVSAMQRQPRRDTARSSCVAGAARTPRSARAYSVQRCPLELAFADRRCAPCRSSACTSAADDRRTRLSDAERARAYAAPLRDEPGACGACSRDRAVTLARLARRRSCALPAVPSLPCLARPDRGTGCAVRPVGPVAPLVRWCRWRRPCRSCRSRRWYRACQAHPSFRGTGGAGRARGAGRPFRARATRCCQPRPGGDAARRSRWRRAGRCRRSAVPASVAGSSVPKTFATVDFAVGHEHAGDLVVAVVLVGLRRHASFLVDVGGRLRIAALRDQALRASASFCDERLREVERPRESSALKRRVQRVAAILADERACPCRGTRCCRRTCARRRRDDRLHRPRVRAARRHVDAA